jgi:hypothetical protein
VAEPDDPLRADDALVGAQHEDVLLGSDPVVDDDPADPVLDEVEEIPVAVAVLDDRPTTELPRLVVGPAPEPPGRWAGAAPWAVFAVVAVVVIAATTTWASWLQGPTAQRQSFTGLMQPVTTSAAAPPQVAPAPSPDPEPEVEPQPEPTREPVARPTQRPRTTRTPAPAAPRPTGAAVNGTVTTSGKPAGESAPKTSAPGSAAGAAANAEAAENDEGRDAEKQPADADKPKPDDENDD